MENKKNFVERKRFDVEGQSLFADLKDNLGKTLESVRVISRYDVKDYQRRV